MLYFLISNPAGKDPLLLIEKTEMHEKLESKVHHHSYESCAVIKKDRLSALKCCNPLVDFI